MATNRKLIAAQRDYETLRTLIDPYRRVPTRSLTVRLPVAILERMEIQANDEQCSMSQVVRAMLLEVLMDRAALQVERHTPPRAAP